MGVNRRTARPRTARVRLATLGALAVAVICAQLIVAAPLGATPLTGGFSPTIVGGRADLNGNGAVTGRDDANAFYGDTHIIDGMTATPGALSRTTAARATKRSPGRTTARSSGSTAHRTA